MKKTWKFGLGVLILVACAGCDRVTKQMAREWLAPRPPVSVLNDLVRFEYVENAGAFLGFGSSMPRELRFALFVILTGVILALTLAFIARVDDLGLEPLVGLSLVAGGGVGNLIDRILNDGAVTDFMILGIGSLRTGIFNLADVAIVAGVVMILLWSLGTRKETGNAA